jgi:predicted MFS family arabinose efflux permease
VMSLFVSAIYIGSGAGAAFGGLLLTHLGSSWPPFAATLATVLGLLLFAISTRGRAVNGRSS